VQRVTGGGLRRAAASQVVSFASVVTAIFQVPAGCNYISLQPQLLSNGTARVLYAPSGTAPTATANDGAMAHEELWSDNVRPGQFVSLRLVKAADYADQTGGAADQIVIGFYTDLAGRSTGAQNP